MKIDKTSYRKLLQEVYGKWFNNSTRFNLGLSNI